ncbi:MAG: L,D-transpeptidase [Prevotellaceae bacterium]|jgi:lipoprotein-anchoring transpeptidase ErfK/SrfK|nr:L,D-transpeptidase [Prevotellaceae bacterium]
MRYLLSFAVVSFLIIACCANKKPKGNITVNVDTTLIVNRLPELRHVPSEIIGKFDGWKIDSVACIENFDGASRFLVKGVGNEDIEKRKMSTQIIDVKTDSLRKEAWSYVVLQDIAKDKPFELEVLYIPDAGVILAYKAGQDTLKKNDKTDVILVSKQDLKLRMINYHDSISLTCPIASGANPGDKKKSGDKRTPEGIFTVYAVHDASDWDYDFKDGKGRIKGTYGKYFVRFKEHYHIGIHGTHLPESLGSRASEGCIRMQNENIENIVPMISRSKTLIIVAPALEDVRDNETFEG